MVVNKICLQKLVIKKQDNKTQKLKILFIEQCCLRIKFSVSIFLRLQVSMGFRLQILKVNTAHPRLAPVSSATTLGPGQTSMKSDPDRDREMRSKI